MSSPLVSIITPTFNPKPFARETIDSVLSQTLADWEWIVVDDGSQNDVAALFQVDPRIRVLSQRNSGQAIARNLAMSQAGGKYFAFLDDDDLWNPDKLQKQLHALESNPEAPFCHTNFEMIDGDSRIFREGYGGVMTTYHELLTTCAVCASTVVARREACIRAGGFNFLVNTSEDFDLWLKMARDARATSPFLALNEFLASYRVHGGGTSRRYAELHRASRQILEQHLSLARIEGDEETLRAAREGLANIRFNYGGQAWAQFLLTRKEGGAADARGHFLYALRHAPRLTMSQIRRKVLRA